MKDIRAAKGYVLTTEDGTVYVFTSRHLAVEFIDGYLSSDADTLPSADYVIAPEKPKPPERKLDPDSLPIETLKLPQRVTNALINNHVNTVRDLINKRHDVPFFRGIGDLAVKQIREALRAHAVAHGQGE